MEGENASDYLRNRTLIRIVMSFLIITNRISYDHKNSHINNDGECSKYK